MRAVVGRVGTVEEVVVVGAGTGSDVMGDVVVDGDDVDVAQSDVDAYARLVAEPEEVGDLLRVGDVVGRLELTPALQVVEHCSSAVRLNPQQPCTRTHTHTHTHTQPVLSFGYYQWRNNRACKACSARGPSAVGGPKFARRCFLKFFWGEEGAFLEYLHAGLLQPCYATGYYHW